MRRSPVHCVAAFQGGYYVISGLWPLLHGSSFQAVTGLKIDFWLAQTVGLLLALAGFVLLLASSRKAIPSELALIGTLYAAALVVVDLLCLQNPRTTWAYLADAPLQLGLVLAWWWTYWRPPGDIR